MWACPPLLCVIAASSDRSPGTCKVVRAKQKNLSDRPLCFTSSTSLGQTCFRERDHHNFDGQICRNLVFPQRLAAYVSSKISADTSNGGVHHSQILVYLLTYLPWNSTQQALRLAAGPLGSGRRIMKHIFPSCIGLKLIEASTRELITKLTCEKGIC